MTSSTRLERAEGAGPSPAERFVLESFAAQAALVGRLLADARQLRIDGCAPVDVTSSTTLEYLLLSIRFAAKEHLQRGDDLLRLVELLGAILDAARGARADGGKTDAGLHLLRAIAMAELLHEESRGRFARHADLRELADATMASLVAGFLSRFGGELPGEVRKAFPGFGAAMRDAWRPIQERRGLLLWLTQRS
ncbi:MAG TPA: hypothetical protein VML91_24955 [Burkholderiales bacterium]|nr:hypothetical protein [Burkholderiales bacterium]